MTRYFSKANRTGNNNRRVAAAAKFSAVLAPSAVVLLIVLSKRFDTLPPDGAGALLIQSLDALVQIFLLVARVEQ